MEKTSSYHLAFCILCVWYNRVYFKQGWIEGTETKNKM